MKVLITGASSGIGRDLAKLLADTYDEMVLVARSEDKLKQLKEEIENVSPTKVKLEILDVSVPDNCIKLHEANPDVNLLINNAGFGDYGDFSETSIEKELSMIQTNIVAYHILTKLYLKDMKTKNEGHILNVASIAGFMPGPLMATYYSTKSYVVRLSEGIREELRREHSKVKISILCPGPVDTNFNHVANAEYTVKGLKSEDVARYTIKHMNRFYIVPGTMIRLGRIAIRFLPNALVARIIYNIQHKKMKR